jgi:hypothetical protein
VAQRRALGETHQALPILGSGVLHSVDQGSTIRALARVNLCWPVAAALFAREKAVSVPSDTHSVRLDPALATAGSGALAVLADAGSLSEAVGLALDADLDSDAGAAVGVGDLDGRIGAFPGAIQAGDGVLIGILTGTIRSGMTRLIPSVIRPTEITTAIPAKQALRILPFRQHRALATAFLLHLSTRHRFRRTQRT